ncbi:MAG: glycosyltransferase family 1 protein [Planctomycetota bacterium]|jgi:glycosyltransferase involved in cell wall biosynthesis|nr:glycosyltransferase family 1 protein [Planctomycetota bacterium]
MKLLFDATGMALSGYHKGGAYIYGLELLLNLQQINRELDIELFFNFTRSKHKPKMMDTCRAASIDKYSLSQIPPQILRGLRIPTEWVSSKHDVMHGPFDLMAHTKNSARVLTIHDLAFIRAPQGLPAKWIADRHKLVPPSAHRAHRIITVSEFSKSDIVEHFQVDPDLVQAIYHGISPGLEPPKNIDADRERLKERYSIDQPFVLYLGTLQPNKNIEGLCAAFQLLKKEGYPGKLVLAGAKGWLFDEMWQRICDRNHDQDVLLTGFVDSEDIPRLYGACDVFALVSFLEGFGIPVIEAMACGAPVVAAHACSLIEVTSNAGLLVDPHDERDIADALLTMIDNAEFREEMISRGLAHAATFTWRRTAEQHFAAYEQAIVQQQS